MHENLTIEQKLFIDHLVMYMHDLHSDRWTELLNHLQGQERRDYVCKLGLKVLKYAETLFVEGINDK